MRAGALRSFGIRSTSTTMLSSTLPDAPSEVRYSCTCRTCALDEKRTQLRKSSTSSCMDVTSCCRRARTTVWPHRSCCCSWK